MARSNRAVPSAREPAQPQSMETPPSGEGGTVVSLEAPVAGPGVTRIALLERLQSLQPRLEALKQDASWLESLLAMHDNLAPLLGAEDRQRLILPFFSGPAGLASCVRHPDPPPYLLEHSIRESLRDPELSDDVIQLICSVPDRLAEKLERAALQPQAFFLRLASQQDCPRRRALLLKIMRLGFATQVASALSNQSDLPDLKIEVSTATVAKAFVQVFADDWGIEDGARRLRNVLEGPLHGSWIYRARPGLWDERCVKTVILFWAETERRRMFREVLNCWSEKVFVTYADDIQIECTTMLLILLSSFVDEINKHDCAVLTAGVTHYLADSDEYKRLVGMVVGKKLAAKGEVRPEKEVQIDLDPECPLMCRYDAWARFASELNNVEKGTPHITRAPDACRPEILPGGTVLHETAPETDPIAEPTEWDCVDAASVSSISSEFSSYAHSSDATSEISAYCPLGSALERPKTLIECLNYLSDSDDPDRPDQGIKALALLVPSANIGELQANIQKITKKVIWAKNNRDYEGFDERRRDVLVGLLSRVPADAARVIWTQVWDEKGQTGIREQLDVLNVIARTCAILSGQEDPKSLDVSTDERATTAGKDAGSVTWKSRNLAGVTSPKLSSLTSVAAFFFHPIVRRLPRVLDEANRGIPFQELLLGSMLRAAAIVLRFSKNIPEYSGMAFELLDALRLLRETDGLLEVVLLAYCVLAEAQHDSISSCLEDLKIWALSVHDRSLIKTRRQEQHFSALLDALKALERKRRSVFDGL